MPRDTPPTRPRALQRADSPRAAERIPLCEILRAEASIRLREEEPQTDEHGGEHGAIQKQLSFGILWA